MHKEKNIIIKSYKFVVTNEIMYLFTNILNGIVSGIMPFIAIYYSRKIINSLILGKDKQLVIKYILLTIGLTLVLNVLKSIFNNMNEYYFGRMYKKLEMVKNQKVIFLDYEFIEKEETQNIVQNIKMMEQNGDHGFRSLMKSTYRGVNGLVTIILSIIMSIGVFKVDLAIGNISGTTINIIFILFLIIINIISFISLAKSTTMVSEYVRSFSNNVFRLAGSYMFLSLDYKSGKDIRIYGKKLAQDHNKKVAGELGVMYKTVARIFGLGNIIPNLAGNISIGAIYVYVGWKAIFKVISIGEIVQYTGAISRLFGGVNDLITAASNTLSNKVYFNELFSFLELSGGKYMGTIPIEKRLDNKYQIGLGQNVGSSMEYDEEKAIESLKEVGFNKKLDKFKKGLDTSLYRDFDKDGIEVSGGEAQKIAMARAIYKDRPFIILDEPTAALDPISEFEIYTKFNEIVGDKTAIYISHRLSSCRFCDDIIVFQEGQIIQRGKHDKLLKEEQGKYHQLWNAQAQYYV